MSRQVNGQREHNHRAWLGLMLSLGAIVLLGLAGACPAALAATRGSSNGHLAFDSVINGNRDIYMIDAPADGSGAPAPDTTPERLTTSPASDAKPSWSPPRPPQTDERPAPFIAFQRSQPTAGGGTDSDIYQLQLGSSADPVAVTSGSSSDTAPSWAPALLPGSPGEFDQDPPYPPIAFERRINGQRDIFVVNRDGSAASNLTNSPEADDANPDWSPAGVVWSEFAGGPHLAFESETGGRRSVVVMALRYGNSPTPHYEATDVRTVTAGQPESFDPSWFAFNPQEQSPGAGIPVSDLIDWLAFAGPDQDGGDSEIHYAEFDRRPLDPIASPTPPFSIPDGVTTYTLTSDPAEDSAPAWSPTGDRIAYQRTRDGSSSIYVLDPAGESDGEDVNVTPFPGEHRNPDWEAPAERTDETFPVRPRGRRARRRALQSTVGRSAGGNVAQTAGTAQPSAEPPGGGPGNPRDARPAISTCSKTGTARSETLRGTSGRDVLCGKGGNDRILGLGGNDAIRGGSGNDRLDGGPGIDNINGGPGRDRLVARDRRRDRVVGGSGLDQAVVDRRDRVSGVERLRR